MPCRDYIGGMPNAPDEDIANPPLGRTLPQFTKSLMGGSCSGLLSYDFGALLQSGLDPLLIAGADTKHYARIAENSFRFTPVRLGPSDMARIHGVNERISLESYREVVDFYRRLILASDELAPEG